MISSEEAERLQLRMQRIRRRLDTDVDEILNEAQQLLDWKYYIRRHPIPSMICTAVVGYMLVPSRQPAPVHRAVLDPDASREFLAKSLPLTEHSVREPETKEAAQTGVILSLGTMALNMAVRSGMNYGMRYLREVLLKDFVSPSNGEEKTDDSHKKWASHQSRNRPPRP